MRLKILTVGLFWFASAIAQTDDVIVIESDQDVQGMEQMQAQLNDENNVPPIIEDAMQEARLDPKIVKKVRDHYKESGMASSLMHQPDKIVSKTIPVMNEPGHDSPVIELALHYGVSLTFKNSAGELLFVERFKPGSKGIIHVDDGNEEGAEKEVSPTLTLTHAKDFGATNLHVWLANSRNSLSFYIKLVDSAKVYADRIDVIVVNPGESSKDSELKLDSYDALTMVLNGRKPAHDAERINFNDPNVSGWRKNSTMWLRTSDRLIFPSHSPSKVITSDDVYGVNVYQVTAHPMIHLLDNNGKLKEIMVQESDYE